jgi:hypothetical protein
LQRLGVTDIFVILIYTLYQKKRKKETPAARVGRAEKK